MAPTKYYKPLSMSLAAAHELRRVVEDRGKVWVVGGLPVAPARGARDLATTAREVRGSLLGARSGEYLRQTLARKGSY